MVTIENKWLQLFGLHAIRPVCLRRQNIFLENSDGPWTAGDRLETGFCGWLYQYHHNPVHGARSSSNYRISMMSTCVHVVKAPITPGQVEILITPEGLVILISCGHWSLEAVIVTTIRVQTRDRIIIIIVVVCREKERFYTMTVTVRQGVGALNARADDLVSREPWSLILRELE